MCVPAKVREGKREKDRQEVNSRTQGLGSRHASNLCWRATNNRPERSEKEKDMVRYCHGEMASYWVWMVYEFIYIVFLDVVQSSNRILYILSSFSLLRDALRPLLDFFWTFARSLPQFRRLSKSLWMDYRDVESVHFMLSGQDLFHVFEIIHKRIENTGKG